MKSEERFAALLECFKHDSPALFHYDEEDYEYTLGAVPPVEQRRDAFLCGEPFTHTKEDGHWVPVYLGMRKRGGQIEGRIMTRAEFETFAREGK